jgi:hypothetical protein
MRVPCMQVDDRPAFGLRGCLWRGPRFDHPALYPALARLKINLLTDTPEADRAIAEASGILLAAVPAPGPGGTLVLRVIPPDHLPPTLRRTLRLPLPLIGTGAEVSDAGILSALPEPRVKPRPVERFEGPLKKDDPLPVSVAWARADAWPLLNASRWAAGRPQVAGLCGELRGDSGLLPPSFAHIAAAAQYGWSPERPTPADHFERFYRTFYGASEVGEARRLLERAVASLPRQTSLADLLDPARPLPAEPRADLPDLVRQASDLAGKATRNRELAALLAQSGNRVLAAATNVTTALRLRRACTQAEALAAPGGRRSGGAAEAAKLLAAVAAELPAIRVRLVELLGKEAEHSPDALLCALAATELAHLAERPHALPDAQAFLNALRGKQP